MGHLTPWDVTRPDGNIERFHTRDRENVSDDFGVGATQVEVAGAYRSDAPVVTLYINEDHRDMTTEGARKLAADLLRTVEMIESTLACRRCGMRADALVHTGTANTHIFAGALV